MSEEMKATELNSVAGGKAADGKYYTYAANGWVPYQLKDGDTLGTLAKIRHTSIAQICMANPLIDNPEMVFAGYWILLPAVI